MSDKNTSIGEAGPNDHLGSWAQISQNFLDLDSRADIEAWLIAGNWRTRGSNGTTAADLKHFRQIAGHAARKIGFQGVDEDTAVYWLDLLRRNAIGWKQINARPCKGPDSITTELVRSTSRFSTVDGCIEYVCVVSAKVCDLLHEDELARFSYDEWFRSLVAKISDICPELEACAAEYFPNPNLGFNIRRDRLFSREAGEEISESNISLHLEDNYAGISWNDIFSGLDGQRVRAKVLLIDKSVRDEHKLDPQKRDSDPLYLVKHAAAYTRELLDGALHICCDEYTRCGNSVTKEFLSAVQQKCLLAMHKASLTEFGYRLFGIFLDPENHEAIKLQPHRKAIGFSCSLPQSLTTGWGPETTPLSLALSRTKVAFDELWNTIGLRLQLLEPSAGASLDRKQLKKSARTQEGHGITTSEINSPWGKAIRQAVLILDSEKKASTGDIAKWIDKNMPNIALPESYTKEKEYKQSRELSWLVKKNKAIEKRFRSSVAKVRRTLPRPKVL